MTTRVQQAKQDEVKRDLSDALQIVKGSAVRGYSAEIYATALQSTFWALREQRSYGATEEAE